MSSVSKESHAKFATDESTLTDVLKSTNNIVKTVDLASTSQQLPTVFGPIPFHMHHGVTGGAPLATTMVTRTPTTMVVSPKKSKATSRSAAITTNSTSIVCHVVPKSGLKQKPGGNKTQLAEKASKTRADSHQFHGFE